MERFCQSFFQFRMILSLHYIPFEVSVIEGQPAG